MQRMVNKWEKIYIYDKTTVKSICLCCQQQHNLCVGEHDTDRITVRVRALGRKKRSKINSGDSGIVEMMIDCRVDSNENVVKDYAGGLEAGLRNTTFLCFY